MGQPVVYHLGKHHPAEGGRRALFQLIDEACVVGPSMRPSYYTALTMFKGVCEFFGHRGEKWALRIARNRPPTCANQIGRPEGARRALGRWATGSQSVEMYGRSVRSTELRMGRSIFGMVSDRRWVPTASFEAPEQLRDTTSVAMPEIPPELTTGPSVYYTACA